MTEANLPGGAEHLTPELGLDIVTGSLGTETLNAVAAHVRRCPVCEERLRAWLAEAEAAAAAALPVRGGDGRFQAEADTAAPSAARASGVRRVGGRWVVSAAAGLAAAAALILVFLPRGGVPGAGDQYWIPVPSDVAVRRSPEGTAGDPRFGDALAAYKRHDAVAAANLLAGLRTSGDAGGLVGLLGASVLYNTGHFEAAADSLAALDPLTLPQPWKDQAMWILGSALSASGKRDAARPWFERLAEGDGELAGRARERLESRP